MIKTVPTALANNYASGAPTIAYTLKITRGDGQVFAFTSAVDDVTISGTTYLASQGLDVSAIATSVGLNVDTLELTTTDDGTLFNAPDVRGRVWQNAAFLISRYNWASPSDGVEALLAGTFGNVTMRAGAVTIELRGLQQYLQQSLGNITSKTCRARFADMPSPNGNNRCGLVAATWTDSMVVTDVTDRRTFTAVPAAYVPGDTSWATVALLLHANGTDGSTTVTDSSSAARSCSVVGNARLRTVAGGGQAKFGASSLYFDGTGDCLNVAGSPAINLNGDFCFEGWVYIAADTGSNQTILTLVGLGWQLYRRSGSGNVLALWANSANQIVGGTAIGTGSWVHWAWARTSGVHALYLGGVRQGTWTSSTTISPTSITLGSYNSTGTSEQMNGYLDEVRLSIGTGRGYTGTTITVPTAAFYDSLPGGGTLRGADWFAEGLITWTSGANSGQVCKAKAFSGSGVMDLLTPMQRDIAIGDSFSALAGCRKRLAEDCSARFANVVNFQGEPHMPGVDALTATPDVSV